MFSVKVTMLQKVKATNVDEQVIDPDKQTRTQEVQVNLSSRPTDVGMVWILVVSVNWVASTDRLIGRMVTRPFRETATWA